MATRMGASLLGIIGVHDCIHEEFAGRAQPTDWRARVATRQQASANANRVETLFDYELQGCGGGFALRQVGVIHSSGMESGHDRVQRHTGAAHADGSVRVGVYREQWTALMAAPYW